MNCEHGERVKRNGVSAKGPWTGHFCPLQKGDPNQCKPIFGDDEKPTAKADPYNPPVQSDALIVAIKDNTAALNDVAYYLKSVMTAGEKRCAELFNGPKAATKGHAIEVEAAKPETSETINPADVPF
jgi:hypothetical protein